MSITSELILLDTHVWLWLLEDHERLHRSAKLKVIMKAAANSCLRVSVMSIWEIGMLESKGRLHLPLSIHQWVQDALGAPGLSLSALTPEIAIDSNCLPGKFHGDPADRLIVATARALGARLVTWDREILEYAKQDYVKVL